MKYSVITVIQTEKSHTKKDIGFLLELEFFELTGISIESHKQIQVRYIKPDYNIGVKGLVLTHHVEEDVTTFFDEFDSYVFYKEEIERAFESVRKAIEK